MTQPTLKQIELYQQLRKLAEPHQMYADQVMAMAIFVDSEFARESENKNELILKLLETIESEKGYSIKSYENTMLCGKGKVTITINIE